MTQYSLYPSYVVVSYHSQYSPHKMTLPTTQWLPTPNVNGQGAYSQWDSGTIDAHDMILDFVELLAETVPSGHVFDDYVIYNYLTEDSRPQPVAGGILNVTGSAVGDSVPAAQATLSFRTAEFNPVKLVILDCIPSPNFLPLRFSELTSDQVNVVVAFRSMDNAWAGRDGSRPSQFIRATFGINDKLHSAYRLS